MRRSLHWLSWIIRLPVLNTDRRHCKKDDDDDDHDDDDVSYSVSYNMLLHLRIKRRPHWVRSRAVRTRVYCVNGTWDGRISELFRAAVTYHWAHVTPTDTSMQFYLADCKDLGTIPPEFGTLVQIVCHITWVFASFTHFPSLRIFVFFADRDWLPVFNNSRKKRLDRRVERDIGYQSTCHMVNSSPVNWSHTHITQSTRHKRAHNKTTSRPTSRNYLICTPSGDIQKQCSTQRA